MHLILFLAFGAVCVGGAVNLLAQRHPINSALSLIAAMAALAGGYLLLGAEFVAAVQVIVYAGAIMVLFVFVIMLLNAGEEEETKGSRVAVLFGVPGMLIASVLMAWVVLRHSGTEAVGIGALPGHPTEIAQLLFHDFLLPFEVTSVLPAIAISRPVVLASTAQTPGGGRTNGCPLCAAIVLPAAERNPVCLRSARIFDHENHHHHLPGVRADVQR